MKNKITIKLFACILFYMYLLTRYSYAQDESLNNILSRGEFDKVFRLDSNPTGTSAKLYWAKPDFKVKIEDILKFKKEFLKLTDDDELRRPDNNNTNKGIGFYQYYKGYKVEGGSINFRVNAKNEIISILNLLVPDLSVDVNNLLSSQEAFKKVVFSDRIPDSIARTYKLKNTGIEIYYLRGFNADNPPIYAPVYKFMTSEFKYFVDAKSGKILFKTASRQYLYPKPGLDICQGLTNYYGGQVFNVTSIEYYTDPQFQYFDHQTTKMVDAIRNIETRDNTISSSSPAEYSSTTTIGCILLPDDVINGIHWATQQCYDFFDNTFSRTSFDDMGAPIIMEGNYASSPNNAAWNPNTEHIEIGAGDGITNNPQNAIDVIGHEFTHGVIAYTCELDGTQESLALNESFSDMLGTALEFWSLPQFLQIPNYKQGDKITINYDCVRSLEDPTSTTAEFKNPDTYGLGFWYSGSDDETFSHTNCGVSNKWFYLLSHGGSGTNGVSIDYCVQGIGIELASTIAYDILTEPIGGPYVLGNQSTFLSARDNSYLRVQQDYGVGSPIASMVAKAWYAVGVGPPDPTIIELNNYTVSTNENFSFDNNIIVGNNFLIPTGAPAISCDIISDKTIELIPGFEAEDGSLANIEIAPVTCPSFRLANPHGNSNWNNIARKRERVLPSSAILKASQKDNLIASIAPNPTSGILSYQTNYPLSKISVFNLQGNEIFKSGSQKDNQINLNFLSKGIYFIKFTNDNNQSLTKKLIIAK